MTHIYWPLQLSVRQEIASRHSCPRSQEFLSTCKSHHHPVEVLSPVEPYEPTAGSPAAGECLPALEAQLSSTEVRLVAQVLEMVGLGMMHLRSMMVCMLYLLSAISNTVERGFKLSHKSIDRSIPRGVRQNLMRTKCHNFSFMDYIST